MKSFFVPLRSTSKDFIKHCTLSSMIFPFNGSHLLTTQNIFFRYDLLFLNLYGNMVTMGMESGLQNSPLEGVKINDADLLFGRSFLFGGEKKT